MTIPPMPSGLTFERWRFEKLGDEPVFVRLINGKVMWIFQGPVNDTGARPWIDGEDIVRCMVQHGDVT